MIDKESIEASSVGRRTLGVRLLGLRRRLRLNYWKVDVIQ
jgi:hypothetical protein